MNVIFLVRILILAFIATLLASCGQNAPPPPPPTDVSVLKLEPRPATVTADYVAQTEAFNTVEIRPRVGGILEKSLAVEGSAVHSGQVLFVVDPQPYQAALSQAKAALAQAEANYAQSARDLARVKPLSLIDAVSQQELDAAVAKNDASKASVDSATASVQTAQLNLGYTAVASPIDGIMARQQIRVGGLVTAYTTLLTTVYATDPMYVNFSVSEQRMLAIQRHDNGPVDQNRPNGRIFHLILADGTEYDQTGQLNFIDPAIDARTGTLAVRVDMPNPQGLLHAGQFARMRVAIEHLANALLVPQRTVQQLQGKNYVWIVDKDGAAQQRDVTVGPSIGNDFVITNGLNPDDTVIVDGVLRLKPGTKVNPKPLPEAPASGTTQKTSE